MGEGGHDGEQYLAFGVHGVDGFLLEIDRDVFAFELADVFQAIQRVSCKTTNRLGDDHVDMASHALGDEAIEFNAMFRIGTGDAFVGKNLVKLPIGVALNILPEIPLSRYFRLCKSYIYLRNILFI